MSNKGKQLLIEITECNFIFKSPNIKANNEKKKCSEFLYVRKKFPNLGIFNLPTLR